MNQKTIILLLLILLVSGCSELGYETKYESDRRLCDKCRDSCGDIQIDQAFDDWNRDMSKWLDDCQDKNISFEKCDDMYLESWNNRTDLKEYQKCYNDKCKWICQ